MKSNNKSCNFVSLFKYLMLVPAVLALVAIVIGAIFHFNLDYDFQKVSNFTVKFNTTVTDCEYDALEDSLCSMVKDNGFEDYRIERVGEGAQNGLIVKVPNNDGELDVKLADLKVAIEENLLAETDNVESSVVVSTTELTYSLPRNMTRLFWFSILALACIIVFVIGYKWIRYNLMAGLALATTIALEVAMLVSCLIAFRIPVSYNVVVPFVIMVMTTIVNSMLLHNSIKNNLNNESFNKYTNAQRVMVATKETLKGVSIYMITLLVATIGVMFFGNASFIYLSLAIIVGLVVSAFVSLFVNGSLWSFWYRRDKDKVLTYRLNAEKKRLEAKNNKNKKQQEDEKIVV